MTEKVKIEIKPWYANCGDGCCPEWGEELFVNGDQIGVWDNVEVGAITKTLEKLGHDVEVIETDEEGE